MTGWTTNHLKMYLLLEMVIFHGHVSFQGCISYTVMLKKTTRLSKKTTCFTSERQHVYSFAERVGGSWRPSPQNPRVFP